MGLMLTVSTSESTAYHHGALRTALVDAALALLAEEGVDNLSLRAVARRAGVSAMAPYRHYPDKDALLAAVAARGFQDLRTVLLAADQAPKEALIEQGAAYVRYALDHPALFRLMFGPTKLAKPPDATGQTAYDVLASRVAAETKPARRKAVALGCWSVVHGLATLLLDRRIPAPVPSDKLVREVLRTMIGNATSPL